VVGYRLTERDAVAWQVRQPEWVLRFALPLVILLLVVVRIAVDSSAEQVMSPELSRSWANLLDAALLGLVLSAIVALLCWPRRGVWVAVVACALAATFPWHPELRGWWLVGLAAAAITGANDLRGAAEQRRVAAAWGAGAPPPTPDPETRRAIFRPRVVPLVVAVLGVGTVLVATGWWWRDQALVEAFRARAELVQGTVVGIDEELSWAELRVGEEVVRAPTTSVDVELGESLELRFDPDSMRAELVVDAFDPTEVLLLVPLGAVVALLALDGEARRRASARRALTDGPVALLRGLHGGEHPAGELVGGDLVHLLPVDGDAASTGPVARFAIALAAVGTALEGDDTEDDDRPLSPRELLEWVDSDRVRSPAPEATEVIVLGLDSYGSWPLVVAGHEWFRAVTPARERYSWRGSRARRTSGARSPWQPLGRRIAGLGRRLLRSTPLAVLILAVPLLAWASHWMFAEGFAVDGLLVALVLGVAGWQWAMATRPQLSSSAQAVVGHGSVWDDLVPWGEVQEVVSSEDSLVIVLRPDGDTMIARADARPGGRYVLDDIADAPTAARRVEELRAASPGSAYGARRRLSPAALVGAAWALAVTAPLVLRLVLGPA